MKIWAAAGLWVAASSGLPAQDGGTSAWHDNDVQFKSSDSKFNFRRSEHFRLIWGQGAAGRAGENGDFPHVTEQLAQGNLQMLEGVWERYHAPAPRGLGFPIPSQPGKRDGNQYRANLLMNNTGIWEGGAWGSCDDRGLPLFALPPTYLSFDPASGATPHEYGHTCLINAGGFNNTPWDGMWHEATANWLQLQFLNSYPGPGGIAAQPYLSVPHGRNYYDSWQIWEYLNEQPNYGPAFIAKMWTEAKGDRGKGGEYIYDAMARLDTSGSPDSYNAIKDALGQMAARNIVWDYRRKPFFQKNAPIPTSPLADNYRRGIAELTKQAGDSTWYRIPFAMAPMQAGYSLVPIALNGKNGGNYNVGIHFKPLWDAMRRSDWRATLVAVNDNGEARYSAMWNGGVNSMKLSADENQLFLVVSATPDFMPYEGFSHPLMSDLPLQPQAYEVAFVNTQAGPRESRPGRPEGVKGKAHSNGGGFVADSAKVEATAYVGPDAMVLGQAQVLGQSRVEDFAVVTGHAVVKDNARLSGHAMVRDNAEIAGYAAVRDWATVAGHWKLSGYGRALERAMLSDRGELSGHATIKGNAPDFGGAKVSGYAIKDGDCANGANVDHQTLMCWVWGTDQRYADERPDNGQLFCNFSFARQSPIYALDTHGLTHGYLMGGARSFALSDTNLPGALQLNGKDQYVELRREVADFVETTYAVWVNWEGGPAGQRILHLGDGANKYAYLTPRDSATGKLRFVISTNGPAGQQVLNGPAPLPARTWVHLAVKFQDGAAYLFIDGKPVDANPGLKVTPRDVLGANTLAGNDCMFLGRGPRAEYFRGLLADFRVYSLPQENTTLASLAAALKNRGATIVAEALDKVAPTPASDQFLLPPALLGEDAVVMSAPKATDDSKWVEYACVCTAGGGNDSGWISNNRWTDCNLKPGKTYAYAFKMRDRSGNETALSRPSPVSVTALPAPQIAFESGPLGISANAIRMTATLPKTTRHLEYKFTRADGKSSGWQASRSWTDQDAPPGSTQSYTVQARDSRGQASKLSAPLKAVARDDTPPARYEVGEWATLPYATLGNAIWMKAMSVTGDGNAGKLETDPVEYLFECVSGNGPGSGWIKSPNWETPPLANGTYRYHFKMRDTSPQQNETGFSSIETATISPGTGYRDYALSQVSAQAEGTLVSFTGKVTGVETNAYIVSAEGGSLKVMPRTAASATDASLKDRAVTVSGCVWSREGEKRVVWAELKTPATASP